jgi:hypothetical protein
MLLDLLPHQLPLGTQDLLGSLISPTGGQVGRAFDIREEDGDGAFGKLLGHRALYPAVAQFRVSPIILHLADIVKEVDTMGT